MSTTLSRTAFSVSLTPEGRGFPACTACFSFGTLPNDLLQFHYINLRPSGIASKCVLMLRDDYSGYCWLFAFYMALFQTVQIHFGRSRIPNKFSTFSPTARPQMITSCASNAVTLSAPFDGLECRYRYVCTSVSISAAQAQCLSSKTSS